MSRSLADLDSPNRRPASPLSSLFRDLRPTQQRCDKKRRLNTTIYRCESQPEAAAPVVLRMKGRF